MFQANQVVAMFKINYTLHEQQGMIETEGGDTLFDELSIKNIIWPHGCLAGACGACRTEILEGENNLSPPSAVEADTIARIKEDLSPELRLKPIRLACRAKVHGDLKIKVFDY